MSIQVTWHNDYQTAISVVYQRPWDWDQFDAAGAQVFTLLDSVQHPVDLVFDVRQAGVPPHGAFERFRNALQGDHANTRQVIFVGEQFFITHFLDTLSKIYGRFSPASRLRFVDSWQEAELLIAQGRDNPPAAPDSLRGDPQ